MSPRRNLPHGGSSDPQLLQISREAQELNQMIDSWPTGRRFHGRNKEIATDLLRGALGLQVSLITLGKIDEECKFMAQTSREHDYDFTIEEEFTGEMKMEAMGSRRFDVSNHQHELRAKRNLRSSRNCVEELKKVIRDSLYRQNLVSISSDDEKKSSATRRSQKLSTGDDEDCKEKHETQSSGYAEAAQQKKARAPNLIARLMGLEEAPPEEFRPVRRTERKKNSNRQRPFFDLEKPEVGKLPLLEEKPDPGGEMLREIMESMQFKGPLKSGSIEKPQIGSPVEENVGNFPAGDPVPPALIIRPVHSASLEMEEMQKDHMEADRASVHEKFQSPALELPKKVVNGAKKAVAEAKKAATSDKTRSSASSPDQNQQRAIRTRKKTKGKQKPAVEKSTSEEKRNVRSVTSSGSQMKKTSLMPRKPEKNPVQVKNRASTLYHEDHRSEKPATRNHIGTAKGEGVKKAKPVREPIIVKQADTPNSKQENKEIIRAQEGSVSPMSCTSLSELLPNGTEHQRVAGKRDTRKKPSLHCEVLPKRIHAGRNMGPSHAPNRYPSRESTIPVPAETFDHIKSLLLSSPCFLRRAQELFNLCHQQPTDCRRPETEEKAADNSKLLLDCAGELMSYQHYRSELANHPMWMNCLKSPVTKISMNQLVEGISGEIRELGYSSGAGTAGASGDGLYTRLERDVKCEGVWANGAWEQGWSEAIPVEEGDGIICDVEKHVLGVLVEEIAVNLLS